ncbi:MAG: hypothetical protein DRJ64_09790, partial [Thermoprotei archaeon]
MGAKGRRKMPRRKKIVVNNNFFWIAAGFLFAGIFVYIFAAAIVSYPGFKVRRIEVNIDSSAGRQVRKFVQGKSIFKVDRKKIRDAVIKQHPEVKDVFVIKKYPSSILIKIIERVPVLQFKMRKFYALDKEGVVVKENSGPAWQGLPLLSNRFLRENPFLGENLSRYKTVKYALAILSVLERENIPLARVSALSVLGEYNISFVLDGVKVIIDRKKASQEIAALVKIIMPRFAKDWGDIEYLDLR